MKFFVFIYIQKWFHTVYLYFNVWVQYWSMKNIHPLYFIRQPDLVKKTNWSITYFANKIQIFFKRTLLAIRLTISLGFYLYEMRVGSRTCKKFYCFCNELIVNYFSKFEVRSKDMVQSRINLVNVNKGLSGVSDSL